MIYLQRFPRQWAVNKQMDSGRRICGLSREGNGDSGVNGTTNAVAQVLQGMRRVTLCELLVVGRAAKAGSLGKTVKNK